MVNKKKHIRLHLTNIRGAGASHLLLSLLPEMIANTDYLISCAYLPSEGPINDFSGFDATTKKNIYKRFLPNSISRFIESTLVGIFFSSKTPLLVFGDIPIFCCTPQTVFLQQSLLLKQEKTGIDSINFKYLISKFVFYLNCRFVKNFIVQTNLMRDLLIKNYPVQSSKVYVIPNPVPVWLIKCKIKRVSKKYFRHNKLKLFYPASFYPHKNHMLLSNAKNHDSIPIQNLFLTIDNSVNPASCVRWISCVGHLDSESMLYYYSQVDALIFMSKEESYGFPLLEAMYIGLPIVCADLPYAHELCGGVAIYFNPDDINSLYKAISELHTRLCGGWWPDWQEQLKNVPNNWRLVAKDILDISVG
jgi:glycosyltransferase involved in cell wall biosynthesis